MATPPEPGNDRQVVDAAFDAALDLPPEQRAAWLQNQFAAQPDILGKITRLLQKEKRSRSLFEQLEGQRKETLEGILGEEGAGGGSDPRIGRAFGHWKIVSHIGSGGLAEVYEACRADGRYEQRAALKILRGGILGSAARELFKRERQLLANLDDPGIVRIIDAGETATGSPWLVMELVAGEPMDSYCAKRDLPVEERLEFLATAAEIIGKAHANLVIHGDLKAEHLLIDEQGRVRLLDFGIAQALDDFGRAGAAEGFSPGYASPEQSHGQALTAASDIYQFGRLMDHVVDAGDRARPLNAVIARATLVEPESRYHSISELAADLRAVIADRPVVALPDTPWQAAMRLVRHNRLAAALGLLIVAGSAGWAVTATLSAAAIDRERQAALAAADREERGKEVLLELFRRADLLEADSLGLEPDAAAKMLDETLATARDTIADDPAMLADLMNWTARAHLRAGDTEKAAALAKDSLDAVAAAGLSGSLREAEAKALLADISAKAGDAEMAAKLADEVMILLSKASGNDPRAVNALVSVAWSKEGDWMAQKTLFEKALAQAGVNASDPRQIEIRSGLSRALAGLGELDHARREIERALELVKMYYGDRHPRLALPLSDYGRLEEKAGNTAAAIERHRAALAISEAAFGASHSSTLAHRNNLALALMSAGQVEGAIGEYRLLLAAQPAGLARGEVAQNLGAALVQAKQFSGAEHPLEIADASFREYLPEAHPRRAFPALTRSELFLALGRYEEAESDARAALAHLAKVMPPGHFAIETARCRVGMALAGQGRRAEAAGHIGPALKALEAGGASVPARLVDPCRDAARRL
ncbi:serine/threonine-protein kinase [Qipengyuania gaetbuli]|uniref:serine/threonine-protein kinase n=1 Tax=Qipengyuania gaetbuli TaxID=266952 RepID=UPI001CD64886|nr:serine/threonine-protein kinase [Qipengyuania gaetbuli]MCA0910597.1 protein kinase [Qipengyuania gaetbuli]